LHYQSVSGVRTIRLYSTGWRRPPAHDKAFLFVVNVVVLVASAVDYVVELAPRLRSTTSCLHTSEQTRHTPGRLMMMLKKLVVGVGLLATATFGVSTGAGAAPTQVRLR
jgi:hypothetical protein